MGVNLSKLIETPLDQKTLNAIFDEFLKNLLTLCKPSEVIIFGSAANGTLRPSSDLDVCLLFDSKEDVEKYRTVVLRSPPLVSGLPIDYLFFDKATYQDKVDRGGVCELIEREGLRIYPR